MRRCVRVAVDTEPHATTHREPDVLVLEIHAIRIGVDFKDGAQRPCVIDDGVEQRPEVLAGRVHRRAGCSRPRARVEDGEAELLFRGVEVDEQVVHLVQHLLHARVGTIDLVDDEQRRQPALERLAQHEPGLWERPLGGVHEEQDPVDHRQRPLHLAAEVRVPRRVDDVDEDVAIVDGGVLCENRDAALPFQVRVVHRPLGHALVGAEDATLVQQRIDERRLAVVDVRDDGHVAPERVGDGRVGLQGGRHPTSIFQSLATSDSDEDQPDTLRLRHTADTG